MRICSEKNMNVSLAILGTKWCLQLAHGGFALAWEIRSRIGNKVLTLAHRPPISQRFACARVPYTRHAQIWVCRRVGLHTKGCEQCRLAFWLQHSFPHRPRGRRCIGPSRGTLAPLAPRAALGCGSKQSKSPRFGSPPFPGWRTRLSSCNSAANAPRSEVRSALSLAAKIAVQQIACWWVTEDEHVKAFYLYETL